ncbi:MAG: YpfJ protein, zinc metalloprotease superfamily, partial [uncultured Blastococcus sp.]
GHRGAAHRRRAPAGRWRGRRGGRGPRRSGRPGSGRAGGQQRPRAGLRRQRRRQRVGGLRRRRRHRLHPGLLDGDARRGLPAHRHRLLLGSDADQLRRCHQRIRSVLLPRRPARVHRPELLRPAAEPVRRAGRHVRELLRHRPRVRPPRAEPAGRQPAGDAGRDGPDQRHGPPGAAGRLLRRHLGQPRRDGARRIGRAADRRDHPGRHRRRARRRRPHRRRLHPGEPRRRHRRPGRLHPRLVGATAEVVHDRVPDRRPEPVRHLRDGRPRL